MKLILLFCFSFNCREGNCKKAHVLKLNTTGKFALNVVDNLVVVHHQSSQVSLTSAQAFNHMILKCPYNAFSDITFRVVCNLAVYKCKRSVIVHINGVIVYQKKESIPELPEMSHQSYFLHEPVGL